MPPMWKVGTFSRTFDLLLFDVIWTTYVMFIKEVYRFLGIVLRISSSVITEQYCVAGIMSNVPYHTEIIQIVASTSSGSDLIYSLSNIRYSNNQPPPGDVEFFTIDSDDGIIYTNRHVS